MEEVLKIFINEAYNRIKLWAQKATITKIIVIVLLSCTSAYAYQNQEQTKEIIVTGYSLGKIIYNSKIISNINPPIDNHRLSILGKHIKTINTKLEHFITSTKAKDKNINGWALGQVLIAINKESLYESDWALEKFSSEMSKDNYAWSEIKKNECSQEQSIIHFPSTSWATLALHMAHQDINNQINLILESQHNEGFWTSYDIENNSRKNASTYSTILVIMMLNQAKNNKAISEENREKINYALKRAATWLPQATLEHSNAQWHDYPNNIPEANISIAISSMAVHILNILDKEITSSVDVDGISREFIQNIPTQLISPLQKEVSGAMIFNKNDVPVHKDAARYYILPWLLIAIKDTYRYGSTLDQKKSMEFLENTIDNFDFFSKKINPSEHPWIAAEYLIGLKYLQGDSFLYQ